MNYVKVRIEWSKDGVLESADECQNAMTGDATGDLAHAIYRAISGYTEEPDCEDVPFALLTELRLADRITHPFPCALARAWQEWWNTNNRAANDLDLWDYVAQQAIAAVAKSKEAPK